MKPVLIVMAKTPGLGRAKRRLAAEIGDAAAARFYRSCLERILRRLGGDPRWRLKIAVTPDGACREPYWRRIGIGHRASILRQGQGGLGERMHRLLCGERAPTLLIGSDIPCIERHDIARAFMKLRRYDAVFGPAEDGGFWLVGIRQPKRIRPFENVRWSTRYALTDTLENFRRREVAFAPLLADVDTRADYRRFRRGAERLVPPRA
ncbi:hypothetical protein A7A08_02009 [Methyloligella halotolerans]|uniref:2-phospho-L-lactate guanylyltransferase n=1 Tax=Methyloligella halotolerans TaxID=1177755 RepID=A0A1E2RYN7_9HYPH|nr:TIGR04282 family arsenosugar biosynthesis glycosyltransferase [Methyloligella halotolerans]ODA67262.1 hypothetical protein A7A08_02009 [Methyloligella halotolerans]